jgi:hypothetical protein
LSAAATWAIRCEPANAKTRNNLNFIFNVFVI